MALPPSACARLHSTAQRLTHGSRETHDVDPPGSHSTERCRARRRRRSRRVDVIHETDPGGRRAVSGEHPRHVPASFRSRQVALAPHTRPAPQERRQWDRPRGGQLEGERGSRGVTARKPPISIPGNECNHIHARPRHGRHDEIGGDGCQVASPTFLPRGDEGTCAILVHEGGASTCERQPPPAALGAATHGPWARRPTALTARRHAPHEPREAGPTDRFANPAADPASARQQHVEEVHPKDGRGRPVSGECRLRGESVPI
jgi:hypothetical protein